VLRWRVVLRLGVHVSVARKKIPWNRH
jgi:hypothetical protein